MAMAPFRRKAGKTARNLALAEAALALARDRANVNPTRGRSRGKLLLVGGAVVAAGAAALLKRDKVAGLLPSRTGEADTAPPPPVPPQPSNYDSPGPVANTATPVPAPDPRPEPPEEPPRIDESAEEAAAAAEAANIGGAPATYAGDALDEPADPAFRSVAEAGGGEAEGQEQTEAALAENATYRDAGMTGAEHQIEDAIEQVDQPFAGETPEPVTPPRDEPAADVPATPATGPSPSAGAAEPPRTPAPGPPSPPAQEPESGAAAGPAPPAPASRPEPPVSPPERPAQESFLPPSPAAPEPEPPALEEPGATKPDDEDGPDDWRTWSGRAVNP